MEQLIDRIAKAPAMMKVGIVAGAIVAITAGNFFFFIQDVEDAIERLEKQQRQLDAQLAEKQAIAQNLNERRREMDVLEQQLAEALTELPEKKDMDELLAQLNDIGKKAGLQIAKVEPGDESSAGFFARIPVKMQVAGNYHEIAMFLQEVSTMRRIVNVNNIKFTAPTLRGDKIVLSSEFLATTFRFLDQPKNPGNPQ